MLLPLLWYKEGDEEKKKDGIFIPHRVSRTVSKFDRYKKIGPNDCVKFDKIWYNLTEFQSDDVWYSKNPKN
jgi:hypothetical protein